MSCRTQSVAFAKPAATGMDVGVTVSEGRLTRTLTGTDCPGLIRNTFHPTPLQP
jgi:hypothetical protein